MLCFTFCVFESFKPGFDSIQGDVLDNKEKTTREKNKFFIPEKAFEKCIKKLKDWAKPAKDVTNNKETKKLGSQEVINVDDALHLIMEEYLNYNDRIEGN